MTDRELKVTEYMFHWEGRALAAEAKLAKAVEALRYYAVEALPWDDDDSLVARTALAELDSDLK